MKRKITIIVIAILFASLVCLTGLPATANATTDKAISISGYYSDTYPEYWGGIRNAIAMMFTDWEYETWNVHEPTKAQYEAHIRDSSCSYCFAMAHGGSTSFSIQQGVSIRASDIENWMANRNKMPFAFLGHCYAMDNTGPGTLSYAYRKGSTTNTVTIGFTNFPVGGMPYLGWTQKLFETADTGVTWKEAFNHANECYPLCASYTKFVGDENLRLEQGSEDRVLNINSDPQGQEVIIDGENVGVTPVSVTVTCTEHDIMVQPSGVVEDPDLWIEDVWVTGTTVSYRIKNIGGAVAGSSHTKLKVDGVEKETKVEGGLNPGQSREGSFAHSWECSGTEDTIEVVADCNGEIDESNEGNNSMMKAFECSGGGCVGIDLTPIEIFVQYDKVAYKIKNQGTTSVPNIYNRHCVYFQNAGSSSWQYQGFNRAGSHAAGEIRTFRSSVSWPISGIKIKVRANDGNDVIECNTENNEMIVTA